MFRHYENRLQELYKFGVTLTTEQKRAISALLEPSGYSVPEMRHLLACIAAHTEATGGTGEGEGIKIHPLPVNFDARGLIAWAEAVGWRLTPAGRAVQATLWTATPPPAVQAPAPAKKGDKKRGRLRASEGGDVKELEFKRQVKKLIDKGLGDAEIARILDAERVGFDFDFEEEIRPRKVRTARDWWRRNPQGYKKPHA